MLEYVEVRFGEHYHFPKQDTEKKMVEVVSIQTKVLKSKQNSLFNTGVDDQSKIDEILKSMIHTFKNSDVSLKAKRFALRLNW
jgi:uncharacterized protein YaaN involved in tellurite resistance